MQESQDIHAILWDLGGVILRTMDTRRREPWEKRFGFKPWELERFIFRNEVSQKASLGQAGVDEIWNFIQQELSLSDDELDALRQDFFAEDRIDEELVDFIRELRQQYKTGMITNAWPDIRHWIENKWEISDAFDEIIISSEMGIIKPDPRIYTMALKALNVHPHQAFFIDDFTENLEGAKELGMHVIHFRNPKQVIDELHTRLGLLAS